MTIYQFIHYHKLASADAIVLRKKFLGMVDHFAIFLGYRGSYPVFVANYRDGVKEISPTELSLALQALEPTSIDRFPGPESQRNAAINRAISRIGERAYDYVGNNCEHFKNWVHFGKNFSKQVNTAGDIALGLGAASAVSAIAKGSSKGGDVAIGLLLLGVILKEFSNENS